MHEPSRRSFLALNGGLTLIEGDGKLKIVALPWEKEVKVTDGTSCGFAPPTRSYAPAAPVAPGLKRVV